LGRYRFPAELGRLPFIRSLRLFGSRARGDFRPRSDINLAVDAFRSHLIDDEESWLSMLRDRNLSVHTYREALAREIYGRLPGYLPRLETLVASL
jgi:nucleotidyltransferase substrate binding protein (TIGR01987 family)